MQGEFGCQEPFNIDNGKLAGLNPQECFVLGYELADIIRKCQAGTLSKQPIHIENVDRIWSALERRGVRVSVAYPSDDESESWAYLSTSGLATTE